MAAPAWLPYQIGGLEPSAGDMRRDMTVQHEARTADDFLSTRGESRPIHRGGGLYGRRARAADDVDRLLDDRRDGVAFLAKRTAHDDRLGRMDHHGIRAGICCRPADQRKTQRAVRLPPGVPRFRSSPSPWRRCAAGWPTIYVLVALRGLQAAGGAGFTLQRPKIIVNYFGDARDRAVSLFGSIFSIGAMIGPIFGGLFVSYWTWRGIFLVNVPIGVAVIMLALRYVPRDRSRIGGKIRAWMPPA